MDMELSPWQKVTKVIRSITSQKTANWGVAAYVTVVKGNLDYELPKKKEKNLKTILHGSSKSNQWMREVPSAPLHRTLSSGHHSHDLHHHHGLMMENGHCVGAPLRGLLFIIALSLHEVLEGVAVGLQKNQSGVFQLFAAVASHKFVISFCVGLELSTSGVKLLMHTIYILVFSLVTPLGINARRLKHFLLRH